MKTKLETTLLIKFLVTFFLIFIPGIIIWLFFSGDWDVVPVIRYAYLWPIAFGFILAIILIIQSLIFLGIAWYDLYNISLSVAILMMVILLTYPLKMWERAITVIILVIAVALPINMIVVRITENKIAKIKKEQINAQAKLS